MRQFLLYSVLSGLVLIHVPRSYIHECVQISHEHHAHDTDSHPKRNQGLTFEAADCDLCSYFFHSLDTPSYALVTAPLAATIACVVLEPNAFSLGLVQKIRLRGPPSSLHFS